MSSADNIDIFPSSQTLWFCLFLTTTMVGLCTTWALGGFASVHTEGVFTACACWILSFFSGLMLWRRALILQRELDVLKRKEFARAGEEERVRQMTHIGKCG